MNKHYYGNHDEIEVLNEESTKTDQSSNPLNGNITQKNLAAKTKFKKGHRRAISMPNAKGVDRALLVVAEDNVKVNFNLKILIISSLLYIFIIYCDKILKI